MMLNKENLVFNFSEEELRLIKKEELQHIRNIEEIYPKLLSKTRTHIHLLEECTHREWITSRVNLQVNDALMRLLYLAEAFTMTVKTHNSVATAVICKAMAEVCIHLGYISWILFEHDDFSIIRPKIHEIAFGKRDEKIGLTTKVHVHNKEMYEKADLMIHRLFKNQPDSISIIEHLYKETNATGHHNYEARMLCGIQIKGDWNAKDRKELFSFYSNEIFHFFLYCDTALGMSSIFVNAIENHLKGLPEYIKET